MAQLDDVVGSVMKYLKDNALEDDTILVFSTDNGAENFTWPDGGQTPFAGGKGTAMEGGFRVPAIIRWPGKTPAGKVENGIFSGLDWFPTFVAAAGPSSRMDDALNELDRLLIHRYTVLPSGDLDLSVLTAAERLRLNDCLRDLIEATRLFERENISYGSYTEYILTTPFDQLEQSNSIERSVTILGRNRAQHPDLQTAF